LPGCAADAADEGVDTDDSAYTVQRAGTGTFNVEYAYGTGSGYAFAGHNSLDEFVRVGERMSLVVPAYFLWSKLHPNDALPSDVARLKKLRATVKLAYEERRRSSASFAGRSRSTSRSKESVPHEAAPVNLRFQGAERVGRLGRRPSDSPPLFFLVVRRK
jgi:hypothetical protein